MSHAVVVHTSRVPVLPSLTPQTQVLAQPAVSPRVSTWQQVVTGVALLLTLAGSSLVVDIALDATVAHAAPTVSVIQTQHVPGETPTLDAAPVPSPVREAR